MSVNENLHKVDSMFEAFNAQDWDRYYELFAESVVTHSVGVPEPVKGRTALREGDEGYLTAFPDMRVKKEHSFGQGDWVCAEVTITGTPTGPLRGPGGEMIPATNTPVQSRECYVYKFEGGEVMEQHYYADVLGYMAQLGFAP